MKKTWYLTLRASQFREKIITPRDQLQTNKFCKRRQKRVSWKALKMGSLVYHFWRIIKSFLGRKGERMVPREKKSLSKSLRPEISSPVWEILKPFYGPCLWVRLANIIWLPIVPYLERAAQRKITRSFSGALFSESFSGSHNVY